MGRYALPPRFRSVVATGKNRKPPSSHLPVTTSSEISARSLGLEVKQNLGEDLERFGAFALERGTGEEDAVVAVAPDAVVAVTDSANSQNAQNERNDDFITILLVSDIRVCNAPLKYYFSSRSSAYWITRSAPVEESCLDGSLWPAANGIRSEAVVTRYGITWASRKAAISFSA